MLSFFNSGFKFNSTFNDLSRSSAVKVLWAQRGRLPRHPHLPSLQHEVNPPFFFFFALSGIARRRTESCALKYVSQGQLRCCNVLRHISQAFSTDFFPRSRQIQTLELESSWTYATTTSWLPFDREETNANGGTKWRQISKTLKNHWKIAFRRNQKISSGNIIAWCADLDGKIKKISLWAL